VLNFVSYLSIVLENLAKFFRGILLFGAPGRMTRLILLILVNSDFSRNSQTFPPPVYLSPPLNDEANGREEFDDIFSSVCCLDTKRERDGQTDEHRGPTANTVLLQSVAR